MFKLNNKGQSLVLFVVIMPLILFILFLVVDIGNIYLKRQELCNINYETMNYMLDTENVTPEDIIKLINLNNDKITDIEVNLNNEYTISSKLKVKGLINMFDLNIFEVSCKYKGAIINNKKNIERVK